MSVRQSIMRGMKDASEGNMMSEATAQEPVPEPPRDVTAVMLDAITAAGQTAVATEDVRRLVLRALEPGTDLDALRIPFLELAARLGELNADLREIPGAVADATLFTAAGLTSPMAAVPDTAPEPRVSRHRAPRQRAAGQERALRSVKSGGMVGGLVAAFRPAHAWVTSHTAASMAIAGTAATLAVGAAVVPHVPVTLPFGASTSPNPPASVYSATPISVSGPLPPRIALALTKPKPDTATSSPLNTLPPVSSPVQGPGDGQDPAPQPSSQGLAPQVHLVVTSALSLGLQSSGTIRIAAFGGQADWSAQASDGGMMLDQSSGTLPAGHSTTIRVSITADLQALTGPGSVTIDYGNGKTAVVPVSWTLIPLPQLPDPVPTVLPSLPDPVASVLPSIGS